jgi:hypothetical protein
MRLIKSFFLILCLLIAINLVQGQDQTVTVPDLTGLTVPQAVATLNHSGFNLGTQTPFEGTTDQPPNSVVSQSLAAGTTASYGTAIDITLVQPSNARLVYDDNDLTLVNLTDQVLNIADVVFASTEGATTSYAPAIASLAPKQCMQLWSIARSGGPKETAGCEDINWRSTQIKEFHFWTQANGVTRFTVKQGGVERTVCEAAAVGTQDSPLTCEFYLAGGGAGSEVAPFLAFAYKTDAVALINLTDNQWMPTNDSTIYNFNPAISTPGAGLKMGDPELMREEFRKMLGDITRLAPGQCVVLTATDSAQSPQGCDVIVQRTLSPDVAFWVAPFEIDSVTMGKRYKCPAATPDKLTRCIVPR